MDGLQYTIGEITSYCREEYKLLYGGYKSLYRENTRYYIGNTSWEYKSLYGGIQVIVWRE